MRDFDYLNELIDEVNGLRKKIDFHEIDVSSCSFSYMSKKRTAFVGYKQGYYDSLIRAQEGMKEKDKLRSTEKNYLKFIKNEDDELIQIETYINGRIDCLFQVHWVENKRYLFPFLANGGYYPTYVYVTSYEGNDVSEEYMVEGNQIVYEAYTHMSDTETIKYSCINYVSGGKYPILEETEGKIYLNPLSYEETYHDNWLNHRML